MSCIIKEKNYLIFELPENKKYYFNINTASFCSVRDKNKPIKTAPKGYKGLSILTIILVLKMRLVDICGIF